MLLKALKALILLFPTACMADGALPNPGSIPLFWSAFNQDPRYHDAAFKAQEAFLLQVGFTPAYNNLNSYVSGKAKNTVTTMLDETPLTSKGVYTVVGVVYTEGLKKQISQTFKDPICPVIQHTINLSPTNAYTGVRWSF